MWVPSSHQSFTISLFQSHNALKRSAVYALLRPKELSIKSYMFIRCFLSVLQCWVSVGIRLAQIISWALSSHSIQEYSWSNKFASLVLSVQIYVVLYLSPETSFTSLRWIFNLQMVERKLSPHSIRVGSKDPFSSRGASRDVMRDTAVDISTHFLAMR